MIGCGGWCSSLSAGRKQVVKKFGTEMWLGLFGLSLGKHEDHHFGLARAARCAGNSGGKVV